MWDIHEGGDNKVLCDSFMMYIVFINFLKIIELHSVQSVVVLYILWLENFGFI